MEWKDLLYELIDLVKATAPILWEIARRQAIVDGTMMEPCC